MHAKNKPPGRRYVIAVMAAATVLASCGSSSRSGVTPLKTIPTTGTTTAPAPELTTTTTLVTSDGAIFAADQADNTVFFEVASQNPVNPADPRIALLEMGEELSNDRNQLTVLSIKREHDVGRYTLSNLTITQRNGTAVVVTSCAFDSIAVEDNVTGEIVTPATNTRVLVNERLDLVNGRWMVSQAGQASGTC